MNQTQQPPISKQTPPPERPSRPDAFLAGFFCALSIFLAVLVVLLLLRSPAAIPDGGEGTTTEKQETTTDPSVDPPRPSAPVFSGGVLSSLPHTTNATSLIDLPLGSDNAVLVNAATGEIVATKNASVRFSPASMTKVMTLIVACEALTEEELDTSITMTQEMWDASRAGSYAGTTLYGIDVGDEYKIRDLLYGIGMKSASDCVVPIVLHVAESEAAFVKKMNDRVASLGLTHTHFDNPVGHESTENYTTAEDMAAIMMLAMQSDLIRDILGKDVHRSTAAGYNKEGEFLPSFSFTIYSTLFGDHQGSRMNAYEEKYGVPFSVSTAKLLAGKTGYLDDTGTRNYCLASYAEGKVEGTKYVLILGNAQIKYQSLDDVKSVLEAYLP